MFIEGLRYASATGGLAALCGGLTRIVCLWMRLRFARHVVDATAKQEQPLDPAEIIAAVTPRTRYLLPQAQRRQANTSMQTWPEEVPQPPTVPKRNQEHIKDPPLHTGPR